MENQKKIGLLENKPNQPTKFRKKNWVDINNDLCGKYNINIQIKFKTLRSSLSEQSDAHILASGAITVVPLAADTEKNNMQVVFNNCAPFTDCISEINNTKIDNAKDIDIVVPMYNNKI